MKATGLFCFYSKCNHCYFVPWALNMKEVWIKGSDTCRCSLSPQETRSQIRLYLNVTVLCVCEFLWKMKMVVNERGCVFASVMIAPSYAKMSSCPSVSTSWGKTPSSDTQQADLTIKGEDSRWKIQADVCLCPSLVYPLLICSFSLSVCLSSCFAGFHYSFLHSPSLILFLPPRS